MYILTNCSAQPAAQCSPFMGLLLSQALHLGEGGQISRGNREGKNERGKWSGVGPSSLVPRSPIFIFLSPHFTKEPGPKLDCYMTVSSLHATMDWSGCTSPYSVVYVDCQRNILCLSFFTLWWALATEVMISVNYMKVNSLDIPCKTPSTAYKSFLYVTWWRKKGKATTFYVHNSWH